MTVDLLASLTTLAGVMLGGGLSFAVQRATQRSVERTEGIRLEASRIEARRTERMAALDRFLVNAQDVERVAIDHHQHGVDGPEWRSRANIAMDRVWVSEKMVRILCSSAMHEAAHVFTNALHRTLWQEHHDHAVGDVLASKREECLQAAQIELEWLDRAGRYA
jgi:hypothetical protein